MMFNGLLMCGDSDTSDVTKGSAADSASGSCDSSRAKYYHNKLTATTEILKNKEETVRIQSESLAVAEARIASLTARVAELRKEIDRKDKDLQSLRNLVDNEVINKVACNMTLQEADTQKTIVSTLQNNLSVIEELYRECFYETVKQDDLIDMLRKSYLDVRLMEKEKSEQIGRLKNVIHTQKWSLERCQDVALEVENLKLEISNFLNSSNYDSGMWERSDASVESGVGEDLQDIMEHLLRLRELLTVDCTCGLEEENMKLRQNNQTMELQIGELNERITGLEATLSNKDDEDEKNKIQISMKEKELHEIRQQLAALEVKSCDQGTTCDTLSFELQRTEELLKDKAMELSQVQRQCEAKEVIIKELRKKLQKTDALVKENEKFRSEVVYLRSQMCACNEQTENNARRVRALEAELTNARSRCDSIHASYREKVQDVLELKRQLEEAQASGATLCAEARHALSAVRRWARHQRARHAEQEERIRGKDKVIDALRKRLEGTDRSRLGTSASETEGSCSKCSHRRDRSQSASCFTSKAGRERREQCVGTSGSDVASCSSAPIPPKRMSRKKVQVCGNEHCVRSPSEVRSCDLGTPVRTPRRSHDMPNCDCPQLLYERQTTMPRLDNESTLHLMESTVQSKKRERQPRDEYMLTVAVAVSAHVYQDGKRGLSPTSELLSYVERLGTTLADCRRRWMQHSSSPTRFP